MIHLLEINIETEPATLSKITRKLAMTGGFEVALTDELNSDDLRLIADKFIPVLENSSARASVRRSSTSYRILELIARDLRTSTELQERIQRVLTSRQSV